MDERALSAASVVTSHLQSEKAGAPEVGGCGPERGWNYAR